MTRRSKRAPYRAQDFSPYCAKRRRTPSIMDYQLPAPPESQNESNCTPAVVPEKPFPFMQLPTELRIHIYRMSLCHPAPILLHMPRASGPEAPLPKPDDASPVTFSPADAQNEVFQIRILPDSVRSNIPAPNIQDCSVKPKALLPALLRVDQQIYREARQVLYSDNTFTLHLDSALHTLSSLHQRSRSLIKHIHLTIPTHHDILEGFADLVRLGLRYCWGLKTFCIRLPCIFPEERAASCTTNVYANAFHILRWLPRGCVVRLEGNVHEEIRRVVEDNCRLAVTLDEKAYLRRQHQMPERDQLGR